MSLRVFESAEALAAEARDRVLGELASALAARQVAALVLSGGRTPQALYRALALSRALDWSRVHVYFADERAVPPGDPKSNLRLVRETLAAPAGIPDSQLHPMRGDAPDLEAAALEYGSLLPANPDVMVLGLGEDGHTASLFPGSPWIADRARRVVAVFDSPKPPARRLTVTPRVFDETRAVLVLATGPSKAPAVAAALAWEGDARVTPARLVRDRDWYVDRAAAGDPAVP